MSITKCRICGNADLEKIVDLQSMALTGIFPKPGEQVPAAPLSLLRCVGGCGLVQLADSYDLTKMYGDNYGYRSGLNRSMVSHLEHLISGYVMPFVRPGSLVVDIGANDGTTLGFYPDNIRRIGVDPSGSKFRKFYKPGVELIPDFFTAAKLREVTDQKACVVTSFAMFYDLENPLAFMKDVAEILEDDGIWLMEQSYLPAMLRANAFDTICHEHLEFYALSQIVYMAKRSGLKVMDVKETNTNGGSFLVRLMKESASSDYKPWPEVKVMLDEEHRAGIDQAWTYKAFQERCKSAVTTLGAFLCHLRYSGKAVYGLGASTKGNVILQSLPSSNFLLRAIGDVNPDKYGCFTPGTGIPIVSEEEALAANADFYLVLPWHFRDNFMENPKFKGRRLIFPLPQLEIVQL
jgi:NDP-4-keto-2,6-dideoxyhexose 3-C-methyltransferase